MSELLNFVLDHEEQFRRARLPSLYSDFRRLRTINPDGYAANVKAWQTALAHATRAGRVPPSSAGEKDRLVLNTGEELVQALESKEWGRPQALGVVLKEAVAKKDLLPLQDFLTSNDSVYHTSWFVTPWHVLRWSLRQLGLAGSLSGEDQLAVGRFIFLANVEECARKVTTAVSGHDRVERIFSKEMFKAEVSRILNEPCGVSETDTDALLIYLKRDRQEIAYDGNTIKFKAPNDASNAITREDETIAALKTLIAEHEVQMSKLTQRVDDLADSARQAVNRKNRVAALAALRSKKLAESTLSQRSDTLAQLEAVFAQIRQASDQVQLVRIMEASTGVLKSLNREVGGVDRVDSVVDQLREEMSRVDEVGAVIGEAGAASEGVDEGEVDDELEEMEREQREERAREEEAEAATTSAEAAGEKAVGADQAGPTEQVSARATSHGESADAELEGSIDELHRMSLDDARPSPTRRSASHEAERGRAPAMPAS
ncbi:MAG: hypothetical protein M1833_003428 [Piccolia ochrophora]|nr:MAG: hypothetical protein M1833_003428 [Piccolia ochrophora]